MRILLLDEGLKSVLFLGEENITPFGATTSHSVDMQLASLKIFSGLMEEPLKI